MKSRLDFLFIGAHPDDCEIMAGGTLLKLISDGKKVGIVDLTRGELGTNGSLEIRKKEVAAVGKIASLDARLCLDLVDGAIDSSTNSIKKVINIIRKYSPEIIFTFKSENRHPDHTATHELVKKASFLAGLKNYSSSSTLANPHRPSALLYFGEPYYIHDRPDFFINVSKHYNEKIKMIECYDSQVSIKNKINRQVKHQTLLGSELFWRALKGKEQWYGALIGAEYAEGFWSDNPLQLSDPLFNFIKPIK